MAESNQTNKYAYLSRLSTKELEAILRADAESPKAGNDEAISYILEVIEQREREHPSGSFPDIDSSWKEFQTIYNTPEGADQSLYPSEEEDVLHTKPMQAEARQRRILRRPLLVAAIIRLIDCFIDNSSCRLWKSTGDDWKLDCGSIYFHHYWI